MSNGLYSNVNSKKLDVLSIAEADDVDHSDDPPYEDIEDAKWLQPEYRFAYPPNPKFKHSYDCYLLHIACSWTANENNPAEDFDKFYKAPSDFQQMVMNAAGCIMIGDSVVMDKLHMNITPVNVRVMIESQIDRENTHQIVYSKWCDIVKDSDRYRSPSFCKEFMSGFEELVDAYSKNESVQQTFFFIMLCENIMFAPLFLIINYCATTGYAPKLCNDNLLVMRDEYIHYIHARGTLAGFRRKLKISAARDLLRKFCNVTRDLARKVIGSYNDGFFNIDHAEAHLDHIVHIFMLENDLYLSEQEKANGIERFSVTPSSSYMILPKLESKINLMESTSTVYSPPGPRQTIDMSF